MGATERRVPVAETSRSEQRVGRTERAVFQKGMFYMEKRKIPVKPLLNWNVYEKDAGNPSRLLGTVPANSATQALERAMKFYELSEDDLFIEREMPEPEK